MLVTDVAEDSSANLISGMTPEIPSRPLDEPMDEEETTKLLLDQIDKNRSRAEEAERLLELERQNMTARLRELASSNERRDSYKQRMEETEERYLSVLRENEKLREEHQALVQTKEADLGTEAPKFSQSVHNTSSDEDVRSLIDHINNLVEDLASRTGAQATSPVENPCQYDVSVAYGNVKKQIGTAFADKLYNSSRTDEYASVLLQLAWQTTILSRVHWVLQRFSAYHALTSQEQGDDQLLSALAQCMEVEENQPTFGKWRSLTHRVLRSRIAEKDQSKHVQNLVTSILHACFGVAIVLLKRDCLAYEAFEESFEPQVRDVIESALNLAISIKEGVMTKNFVSHYPERRDAFDGATMEAEEGEGSSKDTVGCTTRLGMHFTYKPSRGNSAVAIKVFVKAQVVTSKALRDMVSHE